MHSADQLRCVLDTLEVRSVDAAEKYTRSVQKKSPEKQEWMVESHARKIERHSRSVEKFG